MVLLERLAQACVDADTGLALGPTWTGDHRGQRITGWAISVGLDDDPSCVCFKVEEETVEAACRTALDELALYLRHRRASARRIAVDELD